MHLQLTFAVFGAMTLVLVVLRLCWSRLSPQLRSVAMSASCVLFLLWPAMLLSHWNTISARCDALIYWAFIAAYEMLLLLFTLLRPRWLTGLIALILIVPVLSASAFLPLVDLFRPHPATIVPLGGDLVAQRIHWTSLNLNASGSDLEIFYRPSWLPFLQRRRQAARYYNTQCDADAAYALLLPDHKHVEMNCPAVPGQPPSAARRLIVRLR